MKKRKNAVAAKKLWDIPGQYHPTIVALCLSRNELGRLSAPTESSGKDTFCFWDMVGRLCRQTTSSNCRSEEVQRTLDLRFQYLIRQFFQVAEERELRSLWAKFRESGLMPGAFWAVMSHAASPPPLLEEIHRQVTLSSLQSCCLHLREHQRHCHLQRQLKEKDAALSAFEQRHKKTVCHYCGMIKQLQSELQLAEYRADKLQRHLELLCYRQRAQDAV